MPHLNHRQTKRALRKVAGITRQRKDDLAGWVVIAFTQDGQLWLCSSAQGAPDARQLLQLAADVMDRGRPQAAKGMAP